MNEIGLSLSLTWIIEVYVICPVTLSGTQQYGEWMESLSNFYISWNFSLNWPLNRFSINYDVRLIVQLCVQLMFNLKIVHHPQTVIV